MVFLHFDPIIAHNDYATLSAAEFFYRYMAVLRSVQ